MRSSVTVTFREDAQLQLWVPAQMDEVYRAASDEHDITGLATYSNYRRFQVNTGEALAKPPGYKFEVRVWVPGFRRVPGFRGSKVPQELWNQEPWNLGTPEPRNPGSLARDRVMA